MFFQVMSFFSVCLARASEPLCTVSQCEVLSAAKSGDVSAVDSVLCSMFRAVASFSSCEDSFGAGVVGVLEALERFDLSRCGEVRFCTFALPFVRGRVLRFFSADRVVRVPHSYANVLAAVRADGLSASDVVDRFDVSQRVAFGLVQFCRVGSMSSPNFLEPVGGFDGFDSSSVCDMLGGLSDPTEVFVLGHLFGVCGFELLPAGRVAELYGLSVRQVFYVKRRGLSRLLEVAELGDVFD